LTQTTAPLEESPPRLASPRVDGAMRRAASILQPRNIIILAVVIIVAYLAVVPLLYLLGGTFFENGTFTLDAFARAYKDTGLMEMAGNSLVFAAGSAFLALVVGTFLAYVTVRTDAPFPTLVMGASVIPLIVPAVLYTISWIMLSSQQIGILNQLATAVVGQPIFNVFSMPGMIWVEGTHNAPVVYLFMVAAFRSMDPSFEEAALTAGSSSLTAIRRVTLPLARPALAGAGLIMVVRGLESFEVPALLGDPRGIYVFTSSIYDKLEEYPFDRGAAGALSVTLIVLAIIGVYLTSKTSAGRDGRFSTITGKGFRPRRLELGRAKPVVGVIVVVYFLVTTALPLGILLFASVLPFFQGISAEAFASMSLSNYADLLANPKFPKAAMNSVVLALLAGLCVMFLSAVASWFVVRSRFIGGKLLDQLAFLPMVVPGIVLGLALSFVYLRNPLPFPVYGTLLILLIAYTTRFLPYGMRYAISSVEQISKELEESAQVSGASWWKIFRRILVPLVLPGLFAGFTYTVFISVRELSSSILLYTPGNEVLSILSWQLFQDGKLTTVAALGVFVIVTLAVIFGLTTFISNRLGVRNP
jgi:iron(III) transport system permease protein